MGEGESGFYSEEVNPQAAIEEIKSWPAEYWEIHKDVLKRRVMQLAQALAKGANFPYEFSLRTDCLEVLPTSPALQALDTAQTPAIDAQRQINDQVKALAAQGNKAEIVKLVDANLGVIGSQYKVHLQPKIEAMEECVTELARAVSGQDAQGLVYTFKMYAGWDYDSRTPDSMGNVQPDIIIYPYDGRDKAKALVKKLDDHFKPHPQLGSGLTPGWNLKVSNLVSLAQSDRGFKRDLARVQLLDKYFDKGTNFALLKGERANWQGVLPNQSPIQTVRGWLRR